MKVWHVDVGPFMTRVTDEGDDLVLKMRRVSSRATATAVRALADDLRPERIIVYGGGSTGAYLRLDLPIVQIDEYPAEGRAS